MEQILAQLLNGLVIGSVYALIALGLTLIYGILEIINLAHGEVYMVGAYASYFLYSKYGVSYPVAVLAAMGVCGGLGILLERFAFRPLRGAPKVNSLISALGVSIFFSNLGLLIFSAYPRSFTTDLSKTILTIGAISFSAQRVVIFTASIFLILAFYFFIKRTYTGKAMRALAQDMDATSLMGININRVVVITFIIGSALAAASGALFGPLIILEPYMGYIATLKAFAVVILGGFGNVQGTIFAGFVVGMAESFGAGFISQSYMDSIVFAILISILAIRPTGLFKEHLEENV